MLFFSAGVEKDVGSSLLNKILMFGFAFFILIAVSAYVANLAAFLTRSTATSINTIEAAVKEGLVICAHPAVETELNVSNAHSCLDQSMLKSSTNFVRNLLNSIGRMAKCTIPLLSIGQGSVWND